MSRLVQHAPSRGITTLTASVLVCNEPVAQSLRRIPGSYSATITGPVWQVTIALPNRAPPICSPSTKPGQPRSHVRGHGVGASPQILVHLFILALTRDVRLGQCERMELTLTPGPSLLGCAG